jgi:hypothetical protein
LPRSSRKKRISIKLTGRAPAKTSSADILEDESHEDHDKRSQVSGALGSSEVDSLENSDDSETWRRKEMAKEENA